MKWKVAFGLLGITSFFFILRSYGFSKIASDILSLGWWSLPLALSFLPVVTCYAIAWLLVTPKVGASALPRFIRFTTIALAWNNLSPFLKFLGEPVRVLMLERSTGRKQAIQSTVLYNIAHLYGTLAAFISGALAILWLYPVPDTFRIGFIALITFAIVGITGLYAMPRLIPIRSRKAERTAVSKLSFWIRWSSSKVRIFSGRYPFRFWAATFFEFIARFIEGITFYVAFAAMGNPVTPFQAALLDVGRALLDNIFFFIPYQVGSREAGVVLLTDHVMQAGEQFAVSAALLYRLVEILWMGLGYVLWISASRRRKTSDRLAK